MAHQYYGQPPPWAQPGAPTWPTSNVHAPSWAPSQAQVTWGTSQNQAPRAPPHNQAQTWAPHHNQAQTWVPSHPQAPPRGSYASAPAREPPTNQGPAWAHQVNQQPQSHIQPFIPPKPRRRSSVSEAHGAEGNPGRNSDAPEHGPRGRVQTSQPKPSVEQLVPAFARLGPSDPLLASEPYNPAGYSRKWPKLNYILEANVTPIRYYATNRPGREITASFYSRYKDVHAMRTDTRLIRLIGKNFPWTQEINSQVNINVEGVWNAVHQLFLQPLQEMDWVVICNDGDAGERKMAAMKRARDNRIALNSLSYPGYMRIDYLEEEIYFYGLEKDEEYERKRFYLCDPTKKANPRLEDTWIVKMAKHPRLIAEESANASV